MLELCKVSSCLELESFHLHKARLPFLPRIAQASINVNLFFVIEIAAPPLLPAANVKYRR